MKKKKILEKTYGTHTKKLGNHKYKIKSVEQHGGLIKFAILLLSPFYTFLLNGHRNTDTPIKINKISIDCVTVETAVSDICNPSPGQSRLFFFINQHNFNLTCINHKLKKLFIDSEKVYPDGIGMRYAIRVSGYSPKDNLNGTDLYPYICKEARKRSLPLVLVGATDKILSKTIIELEKEFNSTILYSSHGYQNDYQNLVNEIKQSIGNQPCLILLSTGTPKQEFLAGYLSKQIDNSNILTVGGLFDFISKNKARAPGGFRLLGFEWLWRLIKEPLRLGPRYILGIPIFLIVTTIIGITNRVRCLFHR